MVNNIPVNGWPQLKDLEAVQPTLDRLDKIEAWKRTVKEETFTGDDITIENALALPARSLITSIEPIQDLHGLPFPYVGGAYKNKLPMTVSGIKALNTDGTWSGNDYTFNGVKFTILTDSANNVISISANGTTSANHVMLKLGQLTLQGGIGYTLTGCPSGGSLDGYRLSNWGSNTVDVNDLGGGATITVSNDELYTLMVYIRNSGTVLSNKIFYPMLRLSTETDPTFAPYSNICPISGRTAAVITRSDGDEISEDFTIQLGQTVYGADINWDTGAMTVTDAIVDLGTLTYNKDTTTRPADGATINAFYATLSGAKKYGNTEVADIKCSQYVAASVRDVDYGGYDSIKDAIIGGVDSNSRIWIYDSQYASYTGAAFKTAMSGVQLCYKLATPIELTLTPTEVQMLKGYNRVTLSDGYGTIELKALTGANWS